MDKTSPVFDWPGWVAAGATTATVVVLVVTYVLDRRRESRQVKQRAEVAELFGELMHELTAKLLYTCPEDEYDDWWLRTIRLSEAALGSAWGHWVMEPIPGGAGVSDTEEKRLVLMKQMHLRLQELLTHMNVVTLQPGFSPSEWRRGPDYKPEAWRDQAASGSARARPNAWVRRASIVRSAWSATLSKLRTRRG
jgi:hypothetical protein